MGAHVVKASSPLVRLADPVLGPEELAAVERVFKSGFLTNGPETDGFEREFAERHDVAHAVAVANGTVALQAILLATGCVDGAEVIVPSFTFISTATSVLHAGGVPVFADIEPEGFMLDAGDVERRITDRTRAIMPVHFGGQPAELDVLCALAASRGLVLIEDAAQAHGACFDGRPVGGWGDAAMFSFTPTKNLTTGEGGIVTTRDGDLAQRVRMLRNHGQSALYRHDSVGFNWRMTEMQAAIGRVQLARLPQILERKAQLVGRLRAELGDLEGVRLPTTFAGRSHTYMIFTLLVEEGRDVVARRISEAGVECRVYFPPVHRQPAFDGSEVDLPVTDWVADRVLSIPVHVRMTDSDVDFVAEAVRRAIAGSNP